MKKIGSLVLAAVMLCIMTLNAGAAFVFDKDSNFTVEIEDGFVFSEEESADNIFMFRKGQDTFNINYVPSTKNDYWADASEEDLEEYSKDFSEMMKDNYASMELDWNVDIEYIKLEEVDNGYTALVYLVRTTGADISFYQKMYQFMGENNVYTLTYTSADKKEVEKVLDIAKTFTMNEDELQKIDVDANALYGAIRGACVGVCIAVILVVVKKKKDKKPGANAINTAYIPENNEATASDDSSEN